MRLNLVKQVIGGVVLAGLLAAPVTTQAQPTAHYVPGSEGIKAATLPPPGLWVRDYNWFYFADQVNDAEGDKLVPQHAFLYANIPRVLWITDLKLLDGYVGVDALLPFVYKDLKGLDSTFGVGDVFFEATWSWHLKQWDLALGAGAWAPTGDFSPSDPTLAGNGYWTEMLTAGATWYPDQAKKWSFSVLNRYEFNQEQEDTDIKPGQAYTVEGGISYAIAKAIDVGVIGYYQHQVTSDSGANASDARDRVAGIGPEISAFFPDIMLGISVRYAYEFMAESRLQGNTVTLTLTKKF